MKRFALTEEHIKLLRCAYVEWCGDEFGAPSIDPKRPYGNSDVIESINRILGESPKEEHWHSFPAATEERYRKLHEETQTALQVVLRTGVFEPGSYITSSDYTQDWVLES